jgi:biotin carboxyl carrier protein
MIVEPGQVLVVLEAMKVEHHVRAPAATVDGSRRSVTSIEAHQLLIRLEDAP